MAIFCRVNVTTGNSSMRAYWTAYRDGTPYAFPRGTVRGLRQQHGSGADAPALPAFTAARDGVARGLAADVRRGRHRLGRGPGHRGRGAQGPRFRGALRGVRGRREGTR